MSTTPAVASSEERWVAEGIAVELRRLGVAAACVPEEDDLFGDMGWAVTVRAADVGRAGALIDDCLAVMKRSTA